MRKRKPFRKIFPSGPLFSGDFRAGEGGFLKKGEGRREPGRFHQGEWEKFLNTCKISLDTEKKFDYYVWACGGRDSLAPPPAMNREIARKR
jgi:hypothetical protein